MRRFGIGVVLVCGVMLAWTAGADDPPSVVCIKAESKPDKMQAWLVEQLQAGRDEIVATSAGIAANGYGHPDVVCAYGD